ncbi:MAG: glycosyltransferase [Candidatus Marinimicrobia bacterium]|nr:glycosyltransferase [Candidatus Neomarinimicrobiota bacterium]
MKIAMVLERQFPFDERVEKEALSLIENDHTVYIISFNYDKLPAYELYKGIHIIRFSISRKAYNKLSPLHRLQPFYKWIWIVNIKRFLKRHKIDVMHIHDLPLANVGYYFKKRIGCELVLDQHELWSETVKHYRHYNTFIGKIVRVLSCWSVYEKIQFKHADKIITVEEPIKQWYVEHIGVPEEKIIVAPNTPIKKQIDDLKLEGQKHKDRFTLYYAGKIDVNRYIGSIIQALALLSVDIPEIKFNIAGKFAKGCDPRVIAEKFNVSQYVNYFGELSYVDMMSYMKQADLCISLLPVNSEELNRTIVTKIYQYLQLEQPMLVSRTKYIKQFVESNELGWVVDETNPKSIADKIAYLYEDKTAMGQASINAAKIKDKYVWEKTIQDLIDYYGKLERPI